MPGSNDPLREPQLLRDTRIINARTTAELGPLPPGGVPVAPKRGPNLPRPKPSSELAGTTPMTALPPPPVPQRLRDILKDYPEHIERLQETLQRIVNKRLPGADPFERAIWLLESRLSTFISEVSDELDNANRNGDAKAIEKAEEKKSLMLDAASINNGMSDLDELWNYFRKYKEEFE